MKRRFVVVHTFSALLALAFLLDTASTLRAMELGTESNPLVPDPRDETTGYMVSVAIRWVIATAFLWGLVPHTLEPRVEPTAARLIAIPFPFKFQIGPPIVLGIGVIVTLKLAAALSNTLLVEQGWTLPLTLARAQAGAWPGFLACWIAVLGGAYLLTQTAMWWLWQGQEPDAPTRDVDSPPAPPHD